MRLSVALITYNEVARLPACLASVAFADEVVIVDNGSTDGTVELARSLGAKVMQTLDWPGFGVQKNRAIEMATGDWVLSIDADEQVPPNLAREILAVVSDTAGADCAYMMPRLTQFCGQWIRHCGWTPDYVLRLWPRGKARFSDDLVHERLVPVQGTSTRRLASPLLHYSYPTPAHYWRKLGQYSQAWAKQRHAQGRKTSMSRAAVSAIVAFVRSYFFRLGFLDGPLGFAVCAMQAQATFGKYFMLYCLTRENESTN